MSMAESRRKGDRRISDDPNNKKWATDCGRIGFKLLQKMGWSEGKGLGLRGDGITQAIKVLPCVENLGLGAAEAMKNEKKDWTSTSASFEELLSRVNSVCSSEQAVDKQDAEKEEKKNDRNSKSRKHKEQKEKGRKKRLQDKELKDSNESKKKKKQLKNSKDSKKKEPTDGKKKAVTNYNDSKRKELNDEKKNESINGKMNTKNTQETSESASSSSESESFFTSTQPIHASSWKHRSKYIKNKSVTNYSSQDLSAIFGTATAP
jgi:Pin2-interacting protein X1